MKVQAKSGQKSREKTDLPLTKEQQSGIIVAIPCFNEELFIGSVVLKALDHADRVVVIDDGSTDRTSNVAHKAGATVVHHERNCGKGAAVRTAFDYAKTTGCAVLVLMDGDGQHDPEFIPFLIEPILSSDIDMAVGSRYLDIKSTIPSYRIWGHRVLTFFTNLGSRIKLSDSQSGFRAFSPKAINALTLAEDGLSVESEMQFLANESGLKIQEIPIVIRYHGNHKRSPVTHGMGVLNSIMGLISRRLPLVFFGIPGLVMISFGIWEGWRVVDGYNTYGHFYIGPALIAVLLCVLGALSLFTGLILYTIRSFLR
jgi:glycosyltransferase involved in cell wall biosynthesis